MKLDYNIVNENLWVAQNEKDFEIHYKDQKLIVESADLSTLIKGLQDFSSGYTRTMLRLINTTNL